MAASARDWPRRPALLGFLLAFAAAHAVAAVSTSFALLFATRVVAALANAGFLAVALTAAAALVPPDRKGRALAVLLSGTTLATIAGVPGGAVLGAEFGWQATFWAVAALCLPASVGILKGIPAGQDQGEATGKPALRTELAQLTRPRLILVMLLGALVNAGTFGSLTFLAPVVTDTAGLGELWVSVALVLFGAGSFVGVTVAGRLSDRNPGRVVAVAGPLLLAAGRPGRAGPPAGRPAPARVRAGRAVVRAGQHTDRPRPPRGRGRPHDGRLVRDGGTQRGSSRRPRRGRSHTRHRSRPLGPLCTAAVLVATALLLALPFLRTVTGAGREEARL